MGRDVGVFTNWLEVKKMVDGFQGARYKGYQTRKDVEHAYIYDQMVD